MHKLSLCFGLDGQTPIDVGLYVTDAVLCATAPGEANLVHRNRVFHLVVAPQAKDCLHLHWAVHEGPVVGEDHYGSELRSLAVVMHAIDLLFQTPPTLTSRHNVRTRTQEFPRLRMSQPMKF